MKMNLLILSLSLFLTQMTVEGCATSHTCCKECFSKDKQADSRMSTEEPLGEGINPLLGGFELTWSSSKAQKKDLSGLTTQRLIPRPEKVDSLLGKTLSVDLNLSQNQKRARAQTHAKIKQQGSIPNNKFQTAVPSMQNQQQKNPNFQTSPSKNRKKFYLTPNKSFQPGEPIIEK